MKFRLFGFFINEEGKCTDEEDLGDFASVHAAREEAKKHKPRFNYFKVV
jgi:hypothetical protein